MHYFVCFCLYFRSIIDKLGQERLQKVIVVGKEEVKNSLYGQLVLGKGASSSLDELLAKEVRKAGEKLNLNFGRSVWENKKC